MYMSNTPKHLYDWLDSFEIGESRVIPVSGQKDASNIIRQIQIRSRRREKTKDWCFVGKTMFCLNVSDYSDVEWVLKITAVPKGR